MVNGTDVFVIGGGPAGLAAAIAARRRGFQVIVADGNKPPIDKPCGEGLMPDSIAALQELGVEIAADEGYPLQGIKFLEKEKSAAACFPTGRGVGLRRPILHKKMLDCAVALGVHFLWETPVMGIGRDGVNLAGGNFVHAIWIIGADGGQSRVRRWAGLRCCALVRIRGNLLGRECTSVCYAGVGERSVRGDSISKRKSRHPACT